MIGMIDMPSPIPDPGYSSIQRKASKRLIPATIIPVSQPHGCIAQRPTATRSQRIPAPIASQPHRAVRGAALTHTR